MGSGKVSLVFLHSKVVNDFKTVKNQKNKIPLVHCWQVCFCLVMLCFLAVSGSGIMAELSIWEFFSCMDMADKLDLRLPEKLL